MNTKRLKPGIYFHCDTLEMIEVDYDNYFHAIAIIYTLTRKIQVVGAELETEGTYLGEV